MASHRHSVELGLRGGAPTGLAQAVQRGGKPVIRGTRISVESILEKVAAGEGVDQIILEHPYISADQVRAALEYAASVFKNDVVYEVGA